VTDRWVQSDPDGVDEPRFVETVQLKIAHPRSGHQDG